MKQALFFLLFPLSLFSYPSETDFRNEIHYKIDDCGMSMCRLMIQKNDYLLDPRWIYLSGKLEVYYEILILLSKD